MKGLLGIKVGMTRVYAEDGKAVPVTVLSLGPCTVVSVRTQKTHGYSAVQLGYGRAPRKTGKARKGVFEKAGVEAAKVLREFRLDSDSDLEGVKPGDTWKVSEIFEGVAKVRVKAKSKGRGFAGVMKRHNFKGGPEGHGSMFNRAPGSVGASSYPSRVFPGTRMAGRLGNRSVSQVGLKVQGLDADEGLLLVRGSVPGALKSLVYVTPEAS